MRTVVQALTVENNELKHCRIFLAQDYEQSNGNGHDSRPFKYAPDFVVGRILHWYIKRFQKRGSNL
jgi:hypothetical protein